MFERSQRLKEQRRRLEEEKIHVEAFQEVSGLPQKEIEKIACQVRYEYTSVQKAKRKKTAGLIRALIVLAIAGSLSGLLIWGRHKIPRPQTERGQTIRSARNEEELVLIKAAGDGNLQMVRFLLKKGISINVTNQDHSTPLMAAAAAGHFKIVQFLLEQGADVHVRDDNGLTPLDHAERAGHTPMVNLLGRAVTRASPEGSNIRKLWERDIPFSGYSFIESARKNDVDAVKLFLSEGIDINFRNPERKSALEAAAEAGALEVIELLLEADSDLEEGFINAALEAAAGQGRLKAVRLLVGRATDLQAPLSQARRNGYREIEMLLLEARAAE